METERRGLPENAYRELKEGEVYTPIVPPEKVIPEISSRSIIIGGIMAVIFSGATAFLGLKVAQVFEAAIPIAILAVGMANLFKRKSTILENVIIQSIGAASGVVVAGAIFTIPALFILGIPINLFKIFLVSLFGGCLGILFLIPLRRYFCVEMHGRFPFPEATATTEVLVAGEEGGRQAKILARAMVIGGIFDFLILSVNAWAEVFTSRILPLANTLAEKARLVFKLDVLSSVLGLGYIVGLRYGAIICAGSFLSWFILIPTVAYFGQNLTTTIPPADAGLLIGNMSAEDIFKFYVRHIGIGGIACAGIIGIIKSFRIMMQAFHTGIREIFAGKTRAMVTPTRTDKDIPMSIILMTILGLVVVVFIFFRFSILANLSGATRFAIIGLLVVFIISFLFTTVAARAIAIVGTNPVSGMTLMTLILSSVILVQAGLSGKEGMLAALLIGGVVCTALSMAGGFITDLKIGYWTGATPFNQERFKFLGTLLSALCVGGVILLLNNVYGFVQTPDHPNPLPAPQANAMAAVIKTLMSREVVPWILYGVGILVALTMEMIGIPPLAFALGMYIPLELNTPILIGGLIAHLVGKSSKNEKTSSRRKERGTLIASGFIAGGAIMGVIGAILKYLDINLSINMGEGLFGEAFALIAFVALCVYLYIDSVKGVRD